MDLKKLVLDTQYKALRKGINPQDIDNFNRLASKFAPRTKKKFDPNNKNSLRKLSKDAVRRGGPAFTSKEIMEIQKGASLFNKDKNVLGVSVEGTGKRPLGVTTINPKIDLENIPEGAKNLIKRIVSTHEDVHRKFSGVSRISSTGNPLATKVLRMISDIQAKTMKNLGLTSRFVNPKLFNIDLLKHIDPTHALSSPAEFIASAEQMPVEKLIKITRKGFESSDIRTQRSGTLAIGLAAASGVKTALKKIASSGFRILGHVGPIFDLLDILRANDELKKTGSTNYLGIKFVDPTHPKNFPGNRS